ncbi:MAG: Do family serine endopeptidase, partial [Pyrinomonadaceae bacterium]
MDSLRGVGRERAWRLAVSLAVVLTVLGCSRVNSGAATDTAAAVNAQPTAANITSGNSAVVVQNSYADVVARVSSAVVTIRSEQRGRAPQQHPFMDDPSFREFFGDRLPRGQQQPQGPPPRQQGTGSGVIVSNDGYILTNHHVIDGAETITVEFTDRRVMTAKVVGSDQPSDLAVLKIEGQSLPMLPLGNSDAVRVGDVALAIGNPLNLGQTVTAGIISAKGRATGLGDGSFADFLQTDAPINRGNSGGALINTNGELIGINSQILSPSGGSIGIGFAIPSNMAKGVMDQLIKTGKVRRGQLGVQIQPVTSDIAQSLDLKEVRGVIVGGVSPGSAAERAGVKQGDVIVSLNDQPVADNNQLRNRIAGIMPGTEVTLTLLRDGREQQVRATLGELNIAANERGGEGNGGGDGALRGETGRLGLRVEPLTSETAGQLNLPTGTQGVVVSDVDPEGPAAEKGLRRGDVI